MRLTLLGDHERRDHYHLHEDSRCYFGGEYTPYEHTNGENWNYSPTNRLIANFKKKMDRADRPEWRYKQEAIQLVASRFARAFKWDRLHAKGVALVPIPPSKAHDDPMYDPRMVQMLEALVAQVALPLDIRDCLRFDGSHEASHEAQVRPTPDQLHEALRFSNRRGRPEAPPGLIFLFDDMLTTGAHFVAASRKLSEKFPDTRIVGNFIARRILPNPFDDFDDLDDAI